MRIYPVVLVCAAFFPLAFPADTLTDADEIHAGEVLAEQYIKAEGMQPTPQTDKIDRYLQSVGDRLAAHAHRRLPYKFRFDPNPAFHSSFALPGGVIFVGAGILAMMDTEDQLAGVLGHEMEHVDLNQCRDRLVDQLAVNHLSPQTVGQLKLEPFLPGYGHDREFAADWNGVKLASDAGYSPQGAIRLLNLFVIMGQQMTHSSTEGDKNLKDRIAQIQRLIDEQKLPTPKEKDLVLPQ